MGLTFKENCPDIRNTKVVDVVAALGTYHANVHVHDPWVDPEEAREEYGMIYAGERVVRIVEVSEEEAQRVEAAQERWLQQMFESPAELEDEGAAHEGPVKRRATRPAKPQR